MGDIMYTVDRIENNKVVLEDENKNMIIQDKILFPEDIKDGDIVYKDGSIYKIDKDKTNKKRNEIRNKFDSLIN